MNINQAFEAVGPKIRAKAVSQLNIPGLTYVTQCKFNFTRGLLAGLIGLASAISHAEPLETTPGRGLEEPTNEPASGKGLEETTNFKKWAKGRILIMPRAGLPEKELAKILNAHGGKGRKIGQSNLYIVDLPGNASEESVVARLSHNPHIKSAELDYLVSPDLIPNDPYYFNTWHLPKIGAAEAWDDSQGSAVTVAILDSGVDSAHPDFAGRIVPGWNFYDNNSNTSDVYGHGTKVAGAAAAGTNNGTGVSGIAGQSKIMPIRVTSTTGSGYVSMLSQGTVWAADHGARVVNMSFGLIAGSSTIRNAAQYMKNKGGLVVVSAGNTGLNESYSPTTTLIAVSATDSNDMKASWSSYGNFVSMSAPGVGIWTATRGGGYGAVSGTSFASPVTAGVVALMMSGAPTLQNTKIESLLFSTAVDLGNMGRDPLYGYGRVNAAAAVRAAIAATPTLDIQDPVVSISSPLADATVSGLVPVNVAARDNVGVKHVELRVNTTTVAIDGSAPFGFTWDSNGAPNGRANLVAYAFDAAGNMAESDPVSVNVANVNVTVSKDITPPVVKIINPVAGNVSGNVKITVNATDNSAASGIKLYIYIDGVMKAVGSGSTLSYNWDTQSNTNTPAEQLVIKALAKDAADNTSSTSVNVIVTK